MSSGLLSPMSPTDGALDFSLTQNHLFIISPAGYSNLSDGDSIPLPSDVASTASYKPQIHFNPPQANIDKNIPVGKNGSSSSMTFRMGWNSLTAIRETPLPVIFRARHLSFECIYRTERSFTRSCMMVSSFRNIKTEVSYQIADNHLTWDPTNPSWNSPLISQVGISRRLP